MANVPFPTPAATVNLGDVALVLVQAYRRCDGALFIGKGALAAALIASKAALTCHSGSSLNQRSCASLLCWIDKDIATAADSINAAHAVEHQLYP